MKITNFISPIDKLTRILIFSLITMACAEIFVNFEYSAMSLYLFGISMAVVSLPFWEAFLVFVITYLLEINGVRILSFTSFLGSTPGDFDVKAIQEILLILGFLPVITFGIIKRFRQEVNSYLATLIGVVISWLAYWLITPFAYVIRKSTQTTDIYVPLFRYLFSKNILIHLSLAIIVITVFPYFWNSIEIKRKKVRNKYSNPQQ